jgi:hypothetical protein
MKAYVAATTVIFALLTVAHIWRGVVERNVVNQPWYILTTLVGAALFLWGFRLLWQRPKL